jgi:hypothetical protein
MGKTLLKREDCATPSSVNPGQVPVETLSTRMEARLSRLIKVGPGKCSISQACAWAKLAGNGHTGRGWPAH